MKFIENKYYRWYYQIVNRARKRGQPDGYYEKHHVIPKCMGGAKSEFNLVKLTFREHLIAHWLLTKFVKDEKKRKKMHCALAMMMNTKYGEMAPSRWYERAKVSARLAKMGNKHFLGKTHSLENRAKLSRLMKGNKRNIKGRSGGWTHTLETKAKIGAASSARKRSEETRTKARLSMLGKKHTEETKKKLSAATSAWLSKTQYHLGRKRKDETKRRISDVVSAWWTKKKFVEFASTYGI